MNKTKPVVCNVQFTLHEVNQYTFTRIRTEVACNQLQVTLCELVMDLHRMDACNQ